MTGNRFSFQILVLSFILFSFPPVSLPASGKKVMAVTAHPLATEAALDVLKEGGNAADAAIAAQWVLNVVEPHSSGIGGGGFFLYYQSSTRTIYAFDGREKAPKAVTPQMYLAPSGNPLPYMPDRITGGHSVGVPGTLKLLKAVHDRFGSEIFFFNSLFEPAIRIAEEGFAVSPLLERMFADQKDRLLLFEDTRRVFFKTGNIPYRAGEILIQKDLAATFRLVQRKGIKVFYEGEIAEDVVKAVNEAPYRPGKMTKEDLFYYEPVIRPAVYGNYRGFDIFGMGPPSSGASTVIETLNILENFDLDPKMPRVDFIHIFSEAQKLAFRDRNRYLGDPDFVNVPVSTLISKDHAREKARMISLGSVIPPETVMHRSSAHTSHISIIDAEGNAAAFTTTIEHMFGSGMVVPGRGFFLNNELSDFDADPLDTGRNLRANAPESEKRPRSSMSPTMVFFKGKPFLIAGSPGGSTIISTVLNILVNIIDFKTSPEIAVGSSRILNRDGELELEPELFHDALLAGELREKGHTLKLSPPYGNAQVILVDPGTGILTGASDPRGEGKAEGF